MAGQKRNMLGRRLAQLRTEKGVSLRVAAGAIGTTKPHLWELEQGRSVNPGLLILRGAARYYGVTVSDLIGETEAA